MKERSVFYCKSCGNETPKWYGQCPACHAWNTIEEAPHLAVPASASVRPGKAQSGRGLTGPGTNPPRLLDEIGDMHEVRFATGIGELDRVLGGGAVEGSMVLVAGAPGIGKSTLLLQICGIIPKLKLLYVTGEESLRQLKLRANRLGIHNPNLYILAETNLNAILNEISALSPDVVIIDSVQTIYNPEVTSGAGSVAQVKDCSMAVMQAAKTDGFTCFLVGHVNKEGAIAGPKVLEHMVDCVLYFEGERSLSYRIIRATKNRFGSTNEIGVFEMADDGLREVPNPSEMLLSGRPKNCPGSCVTCVMEGTRPILAEIQALVAPVNSQNIRRNANGIDFNRALLLLAVIEKRGRVSLSGADVYLNVIGGLEVDEPAADLATVLAVISGARDKAIPYDAVAIGEVSLTGELRSITGVNQRLAEIARLGFHQCIVPAHGKEDYIHPDGLELLPARNIVEAARFAGVY